MNATQVEAEVLVLISKSPLLLTFRYMTAAGLTLFLYDSAMVVGDEVQLIYMQPLNAIRAAFIFTRCVTFACLFLTAYVTSGFASHTTQFCRNWSIVAGIGILLAFAFNNYILMCHLYSLYDHRKTILRISLIACATAYIIALPFVVLSVREMLDDNIAWDPVVYHTCVLTKRIRFAIGIWLPQVAFELFMFVLTIVNAAERPRRAQSKLISDLTRDGLMYILVVFAIRVINLVLFSQPDPAYNFMTGFFTWAVTILTLSRLVLRVERMRFDAAKLPDYMTTMELTLRGIGTDSQPRVIVDTTTTVIAR